MESVFGKDRSTWLCPIYGEGPAGDGVHWLNAEGEWEGLEFEASGEPLPEEEGAGSIV